MESIHLIECPRDAMQGIDTFIPTAHKTAYLQSLLGVGFDVLDAGSFVSARAIPQLRDTAAVLEQLDFSKTSTQLLVIVANARGAREALLHDCVGFLGYPLSLSETFQQRNTHSSIAQSFETLWAIHAQCLQKNRQVVVYLSMGFGNPYGDPYSEDEVLTWLWRLHGAGLQICSLADTVGLATPPQVRRLFTRVRTEGPRMDIGVHLHARPQDRWAKLDAAFTAGCRRFDAAVGGYGGCPMAADQLVGNMATETLLQYLQTQHIALHLHTAELEKATKIAARIFSSA